MPLAALHRTHAYQIRAETKKQKSVERERMREKRAHAITSLVQSLKTSNRGDLYFIKPQAKMNTNAPRSSVFFSLLLSPTLTTML